jgi:hypothetical protein
MSSEHWIIVNNDGTLTMHTENDGWTFLRHGAEAVEYEVIINLEKKSFERPGGTFALWSETCFFQAITGLLEKGFLSPERAAELLADNPIYIYRQKSKKSEETA